MHPLFFISFFRQKQIFLFPEGASDDHHAAGAQFDDLRRGQNWRFIEPEPHRAEDDAYPGLFYP